MSVHHPLLARDRRTRYCESDYAAFHSGELAESKTESSSTVTHQAENFFGETVVFAVRERKSRGCETRDQAVSTELQGDGSSEESSTNHSKFGTAELLRESDARFSNNWIHARTRATRLTETPSILGGRVSLETGVTYSGELASYPTYKCK